MTNLKLKPLSSEFNSFDNAYELEIDTSLLAARNARNKYTKRKHWVESNAKGTQYRYCYSTFDVKRQTWCNPKKGTYADVVAMIDNPANEKTRNNGDVAVLKLSGYDSNEYLLGIKDKYELDKHQLKALDNLLYIKKAYEDAYSKAIEKAKEEKKNNSKTLTDYKFHVPYTEKEINKCTEDLELIKVYVSGYGIKKRCRKSDYFHDKLYYIVPRPDQKASCPEAQQEVLNNPDTLKAATTFLTDKFREVSKAELATKKTTYQAPQGDSMFYGFKEMMMSHGKTVRLV